MKKRLPYWDNLKGFLILLVVFGHLLQLTENGSETAVYKLIYLFHMPLFIFCSGALSTFSLRKMLKSLLLPYLLLQVICCLCTKQPVQLITPYWMLWYLPALFVWRLCIPFLSRASRKTSVVVVALLLLLGCAAGFVDKIGYTFTLSRVLVFAPYFAAGYYAKKHAWFKPEQAFSRKAVWFFSAASLLLCAAFLYLSPLFRAEWLYGTYSYKTGGYSVFFRAVQYASTAVIGFTVLLLTPKKQTVFTAWGRESFTLYIAHIALLPLLQTLFPKLMLPLQYILCVAAALLFCAVIPWLKARITQKRDKPSVYN